jgi:uncharacterized PurR-regulated membrane protein YhhQ (DUF165 family)
MSTGNDLLDQQRIRKVRRLIFLAIATIVISYVTLQINTISHEHAHEVIQEYYGCINSTIKYSFFGGETICYEYYNRTAQDKDFEYMLHSMNEIYSYNQTTLILFIGMVAFVICSVLTDITHQNF